MSKTQPLDGLNDPDLLRLSAKGNEEAFLILYRRHQAAIFRFALHMSGCRNIAEEVTQEVFMTLLAEPRLYAANRGPLQGYLIGIARNKVRRQIAQNRRPTPEEFVPEQNISLLDGLSKQQELTALRAAVLKLPPNYREVIVLCDLENMDYAQTAEHLGCAIGTVRSRLHRARAILAAKLRRTQTCPA